MMEDNLRYERQVYEQECLISDTFKTMPDGKRIDSLALNVDRLYDALNNYYNQGLGPKHSIWLEQLVNLQATSSTIVNGESSEEDYEEVYGHMMGDHPQFNLQIIDYLISLKEGMLKKGKEKFTQYENWEGEIDEDGRGFLIAYTRAAHQLTELTKLKHEQGLLIPDIDVPDESDICRLEIEAEDLGVKLIGILG